MYLGDTCIFFLNLELLRILTTHVASPHPAFIHIWIFEEASSIFWEHAVNERKIEVHPPLRIMILKIGIFRGFFLGGGGRFWISLPSPLSKKDATCLLISFFLHTNLLLKIFFCILGEEICHHNFCKSNDWRQYLT